MFQHPKDRLLSIGLYRDDSKQRKSTPTKNVSPTKPTDITRDRKCIIRSFFLNHDVIIGMNQKNVHKTKLALEWNKDTFKWYNILVTHKEQFPII